MIDALALAGDLAQVAPWPIPRRVFVIAEIGINHNGSVDLAKQLIDMAKRAGCDAVKFQKRTIDIVYTEQMLDSPRESPWGTTQRAQKEGLEFGRREYDEIDAHCKAAGIEWFASAWDIPSLEFMRPYDLRYNKIASAMMTHRAFVEAVAAEKKPTFISTGMCGWDEVDAVVALFREAGCPFVLMHTVSEYPASEDILNLGVINALRQRYGCPVGYSGHEASVSPSVVAAVMGAVAVERHVTLDRAMYGSDQAASLERPGLESLVAQIRKIPVMLGGGDKTCTEGEMSVAGKLRYWQQA
ncbi:MAG: N-acetylneuraminate synthase family protein [Caulobacter sp.]|nr:N-acetylneuraminate synthase family protein [Caulobacter sp.]